MLVAAIPTLQTGEGILLDGESEWRVLLLASLFLRRENNRILAFQKPRMVVQTVSRYLTEVKKL